MSLWGGKETASSVSLRVCLRAISVIDHKNPLMDIFKRIACLCHFISIVDNIVNLS